MSDSDDSTITINLANGITYSISKETGELPLSTTSYALELGQYVFVLTYNGNTVNWNNFLALFEKDVLVIIPDYLEVLNSANFQSRLNDYLNANLAVELSFEVYPLGVTALSMVIPRYAAWVNSMCYVKNELPQSAPLSEATSTFINTLMDAISE